MAVVTIQPNQQLTLPAEFFEQLRWKEGQKVYVYLMEDGVTIRSKPSKVLEAAEEIEAIMKAEGVTADDLLKGVAEQRERRYQQRKQRSKTKK
jgi:AbrB family looped-hinge helix DNA binding protein